MKRSVTTLISIFLLSFIVISLTSCSGTYEHELAVSPTEPLRLAVLPFRFKNKDGQEIAEPTSNVLLDSVNPLASVPTGSATQVARRLVEQELTRTSFDLLNPFLIEAEAAHHGFTDPNGMFMAAKIQSVSPEEWCGEVLKCDAVLFGTVNRWDRSYYGLESVNSVDLELSIYSGKTGKRLFYSHGIDSERRGVSGGPTGFADLLIEPLKGLDAGIIEELAQKVVEKMVKPLRAIEAKDASKDATPPGIYAAGHDSLDGHVRPAGKISNSTSQRLVVLMYGNSKKEASFSIGNTIRNIPMIEKSPGHYVGEYIPLESDTFSNEAVTVTLHDPHSDLSTLQVVAGPSLWLP